MSTRQRPQPRAPKSAIVSLQDGAARVGYSPESLRKMMWRPDPPPLFKLRGRWWVRLVELDDWAERRDAS